MARGHRPNWRTDTRKPRIKDGICTISHCSRSSGIIYYTAPMCNVCWDYYAELTDGDALKRILGVRIKPKIILDDFEEEMFS